MQFWPALQHINELELIVTLAPSRHLPARQLVAATGALALLLTVTLAVGATEGLLSGTIDSGANSFTAPASFAYPLSFTTSTGNTAKVVVPAGETSVAFTLCGGGGGGGAGATGGAGGAANCLSGSIATPSTGTSLVLVVGGGGGAGASGTGGTGGCSNVGGTSGCTAAGAGAGGAGGAGTAVNGGGGGGGASEIYVSGAPGSPLVIAPGGGGGSGAGKGTTPGAGAAGGSAANNTTSTGTNGSAPTASGLNGTNDGGSKGTGGTKGNPATTAAPGAALATTTASGSNFNGIAAGKGGGGTSSTGGSGGGGAFGGTSTGVSTGNGGGGGGGGGGAFGAGGGSGGGAGTGTGSGGGGGPGAGASSFYGGATGYAVTSLASSLPATGAGSPGSPGSAGTAGQAGTVTIFGARDLGTSSACGTALSAGNHACSGPTVTAQLGRSELILINLVGSNQGAGAPKTTVSSVSGPFTSVASLGSQQYDTGTSTNYMFAFKAVGTGSTAATTITFDNGTTQGTVATDVLELAVTRSIVRTDVGGGQCTSGGKLCAVTSGGSAADAELVFIVNKDGNTITAPSGWTTFGSGNGFGSYGSAKLQASASWVVTTNNEPYGFIALDINP